MKHKLPMNLFVAADLSGGIGLNGKLPWILKGDMAFFKKVTQEVTQPGKRNAVLMGRRTWESIPEKFRPLANRINIILSTTLKEAPIGTHVVRSFEEAVDLLETPELSSSIENVFNIGGSQLYETVMKSDHPIRLYYTRVMKEFQCDTFFPKVNWENYEKIQLENIDPNVKEENSIQYYFEVYDKICKD